MRLILPLDNAFSADMDCDHCVLDVTVVGACHALNASVGDRLSRPALVVGGIAERPRHFVAETTADFAGFLGLAVVDGCSVSMFWFTCGSAGALEASR